MKLPVISGLELIKALSKIGYRWVRTSGSHANLRLDKAPFTRTTVPLHKEVSKGTLRQILDDTTLTREQLDELL